MILIITNHALRSEKEFDWATNIRDSKFLSLTFVEYDKQGMPVGVYKGIIPTEELFKLLLVEGLVEKQEEG